ncbi:MAG: YkvA family protein [Rhodospirillales bacterium]
MSDRPDDEKRVRERFRDKVRRTLGRVSFVEEACAAYFCATDPGTPWHVKAVIVGALAYFIMPADMIPDIIAGLGYTDDAAVFWAAWRAVSAYVTDAHRDQARAFLARLRDG